jgi:hypothetical protein
VEIRFRVEISAPTPEKLPVRTQPGLVAFAQTCAATGD